MTRIRLEKLIDVVESESPNRHSRLHGPQHWKCVARVGIRLARQTKGASPLVAFLFGLLHDSMRENDNYDPEHGERGALYTQALAGRGLLSLPMDAMPSLVHACRTHTEGAPTTDPVIGVCYDADRLNLWRVGIRPEEEYLSTQVGKEFCSRQDTYALHDTPQSWSAILDELFQENR